jgi:uncharacterized protein (DUF2235 family)
MRNLVMGFDGTWNTPDQTDRDRQVPTNVVKLLRALQPAPNLLKYYDTGVGTGRLLDKLWGGAAGRGFLENVRDGWSWLGQHYRPGDQVFLFGFSRGAYTARSLAGMLAVCGICPAGAARGDDTLADEACRLYRERNSHKRARLGAQFRHAYHALALNEQRAAFAPTLWQHPVPDAVHLSAWQRWRSVARPEAAPW